MSSVFLIYKDKPSDLDDSWWLWDKMIAVAPTYEAAQAFVLEHMRAIKDGETLEWERSEYGTITPVYRNAGKRYGWEWSRRYIKEIDVQDSVVVVMEDE